MNKTPENDLERRVSSPLTRDLKERLTTMESQSSQQQQALIRAAERDVQYRKDCELERQQWIAWGDAVIRSLNDRSGHNQLDGANDPRL